MWIELTTVSSHSAFDGLNTMTLVNNITTYITALILAVIIVVVFVIIPAVIHIEPEVMLVCLLHSIFNAV